MIISSTLMATLQIISAIYLIDGVRRIRNFYKERAEDYFNTKWMFVHASSFVLYLVAVLTYGIFVIVDVHDTSK